MDRSVFFAPVPDGERPSGLYEVTLNGEAAPLYEVRVSAMPFNRPWPGCERPVEQSELAAMTYFEMTSPVTVTVKAKRKIDDITVRPLSKGVKAAADGDTASFVISEPGQYSVEINGRHNNLHVFADAPEIKPDKNDFTYRFGPGVHDAGNIVLNSNESVYIAAGAVVHGAIQAYGAENVRICGRGILDYSKMSRHDPLHWEEDGIINLARCKNVTVEGIILRDSSWWTITSFNCADLLFSGLKAVGMWRYNSDGFDFVNCQRIRVTGCFLRNFDDVIVFKGLRLHEMSDGYKDSKAIPPYERIDPRDYLVENCVLWCDWGGALEIGAETVADEYSGIVYRNCDIIRVADGAMRIQSGDRAVIHNVRYENIRVEYSKYDTASVFQQSDGMRYEPPAGYSVTPVATGWMYNNLWTKDGIYGNVYDITYRDIAVYTDEGMPAPKVVFKSVDRDHKFDGITIENFTLNGKPFKPEIEVSEYTENIIVR
ncbi:MAG: hypothetical protein J5879_02335 [Clostridia bacterium]|nr:hypothetical protein [Clostridia bacterium]